MYYGFNSPKIGCFVKTINVKIFFININFSIFVEESLFF